LIVVGKVCKEHEELQKAVKVCTNIQFYYSLILSKVCTNILICTMPTNRIQCSR